MKSKCDVLVVLDCCNSGHVATEKLVKADPDYAKEVIAATSWATETQDKLAPALCKALKPWAEDPENLSAGSLQEKLTTELHAALRKKKEEIQRWIGTLKSYRDNVRNDISVAETRVQEVRLKAIQKTDQTI